RGPIRGFITRTGSTRSIRRGSATSRRSWPCLKGSERKKGRRQCPSSAARVELELQAQLLVRFDGDPVYCFGLVFPAAHGCDGSPVEDVRGHGAGDDYVAHLALGGDREADIDRA